MNYINYIPQMYKAVVPVAVGAILWAAAQLDIAPDMTVKDAVEVLVISALVWFVPNKNA